jgi:hypothetical protein
MLLRFNGWCKSASEISRAVNDFNIYIDEIDCNGDLVKRNRFMRRCSASILKKFPNINEDDYVFALDDTGNPKYGNRQHGVGIWANSSGGKYMGQKILVLALVNLKKKLAYPVAYCFLKKKIKNSLEEHETGHEAGIRLLKETISNGFPKLPLVADSWFGSIKMAENVSRLGIDFVSELKSNRNMKENISPFVQFKKAPEVFNTLEKVKTDSKRKYPDLHNKKNNIKYYSEKKIFLKNSNKAYKATAVYNKKSDKAPFSVYISTNIKRNGEWIWTLARARWAIECMFRVLKQDLSFGCLPSECKQGSDLSVCLPFALYIELCLREKGFWGTEMLKSGTIGTLVRQIRELNLNKTLEIITINKNHSCFKRLRGRRDITRINKKPVNSTSELKVA